jgi:ATP-dependent helicase HrpA
VKEEKKILQLTKYNRYLESLLSSLSQRSTLEKSQKIEEFFWLLEEYKISLFAPEIKTAVKISATRLDKFLTKLSTMI